MEFDKKDIHKVGRQQVVGIGQARKAMKKVIEQPMRS